MIQIIIEGSRIQLASVARGKNSAVGNARLGNCQKMIHDEHIRTEKGLDLVVISNKYIRTSILTYPTSKTAEFCCDATCQALKGANVSKDRFLRWLFGNCLEEP